ncbi:MAG: arsenate reductase (glutaredoxin) [Acidiferrobacterales bacterium]
MMSILIYHNPHCSKSRQTLALLQKNKVTPEIIDYLSSPPSENELSEIIKKLNISVHDLVRKNEKIYKVITEKNPAPTDSQLIQAMATNPILIQRPIVIKGEKAVIGRPPENVLEIL